MDWIIGNRIPHTSDAVVFELWMDNGDTREASRKSSLDFSNLFFSDCTHPAQNAYCDIARVSGWRVLDKKSPEATQKKRA